MIDTSDRCTFCDGLLSEDPVLNCRYEAEHYKYQVAILKAENAALKEAMTDALKNCETCIGVHWIDDRCARCQTFWKLLHPLTEPPEVEK